MLNNWFGFKAVSIGFSRTYGAMLRFCGIDLSIVFLGWLDDWMLIDVRVPCNHGIYAQLGPVLFTLGRLPEEVWYNYDHIQSPES